MNFRSIGFLTVGAILLVDPPRIHRELGSCAGRARFWRMMMRFLRWTIWVLVLGAAGLILTGGYFHLRDWTDLYRHLPSEFPGSAVVRIGFPINAALSALIAVALLVSLFAPRALLPYAVAGAIVFQAGSLAALIKSRTGTLFGWSELGWAGSAGQIRAVEIAALAVLSVMAMVLARARGLLHSRPALVTVDAV